MTRKPMLIIAAGGTGGHMFPAQALAETMLARGWRVSLSTDPRGARYASGFPAGVEISEISSASFARGGLFAKIRAPFSILRGTLKMLWRMWRSKPDLVIGFGGYPTIPALGAAWILRLPRMIHEQNGVLGRVNSVFAKKVDCIACGTWPTALPDGAHGVHVGNPVRAAVRARAGAGYIPPGPYPVSILVIGGSQGARALSDIVPPALASLPEDILHNLRISHQARAEDMERVESFYTQHGMNADIRPFFTDLPERMAEAQLVISRAGASSLADICVIGRPSILIPYPIAAGDHQSANAKPLAKADAAIVIPQFLLDSQSLADAISAIMENDQGALRMSVAALTLARPDAAEDLAMLVEELAHQGKAKE